MKVLIIGKGGQLAWELEQLAPNSSDVTCVGIEELDITNELLVSEFINEIKPDVVINAAAYTAVDLAEKDKKTAYAVNELGVKYLAVACKKVGARVIHVSTDFVFDGESSTPYQTDTVPNPINVYGASKLAGDIALQDILPESSVIVRTAWVYSKNGNNFVKSMLRLMKEKNELGIVYDQLGSPTWAKGLAECLWRMTDNSKLTGLFHWTDAGVASWYDFAVSIQELAIEKGLLKSAIPIYPIASEAYPTPAKRPAYSVLDKSNTEKLIDVKTVHWRKQLSVMMDEL